MFNKFRRILTPLLIIIFLISIVAIGAPTYVNLGPTSEITGDVGVPANKGYYIGDALFSTAGLVDIGALAKTDGNFIVGDGNNWIVEGGTTARASLGLTIGTHVQAYDAGLLSLAGLTYASDSFIKVTATDTYVIRTISETKTDLSLNNVENLKVKLNATSAPTVNDDVDLGYAVGSRWVDITNDKEYVCLDNTDGAAVWTETTGAGGGASTFIALTDTPANYTGQAGKFPKVNEGETALEFATLTGGGDVLGPATSVDNSISRFNGTDNKTIQDSLAIIDDGGSINIPSGQSYKINNVAVVAVEVDPTVDSDAELKAILVDEVTKTGDFTAGRITKINNATGIIEQGTNTDSDVADAVTKKHTQNTDTQFDFYNALVSDHLYSGDIDSEPVGETVAFGQLLYFNWTDKEWKITDADSSTTMPGLRIALEAKADGQTCKMLVRGYIRDDSAFEFAGAMVYASATAGAMTSTAPSGAGQQLQRVGQAKSADILFFDSSIDVGEI